MFDGLIGKICTVRIKGSKDSIIGILKHIDTSKHGSIGNAVIENDNQVVILKGSEIQTIAVNTCPYYVRNHNPSNFCSLMLEVCEQATENAADFERCLQFRFKNRFAGYQCTQAK